jgi:hypothetical protein
MLSGVLEQSRPPKPDADLDQDLAPAEPTTKGRGASPAAKAARAPASRTAKRVKGRTVYLGDDLFERIIVQAHRKDVTISDYIAGLLERHVPDHRRIVSGPAPVAVEPEDDREG